MFVRVAAHSEALLLVTKARPANFADALDEFVEECDHAWEARLIEWAVDNGYPDFETVLEYAL